MKIDMRIKSKATKAAGVKEYASFTITDCTHSDLLQLACFFLRMHDSHDSIGKKTSKKMKK